MKIVLALLLLPLVVQAQTQSEAATFERQLTPICDHLSDLATNFKSIKTDGNWQDAAFQQAIFLQEEEAMNHLASLTAIALIYSKMQNDKDRQTVKSFLQANLKDCIEWVHKPTYSIPPMAANVTQAAIRADAEKMRDQIVLIEAMLIDFQKKK